MRTQQRVRRSRCGAFSEGAPGSRISACAPQTNDMTASGYEVVWQAQQNIDLLIVGVCQVLLLSMAARGRWRPVCTFPTTVSPLTFKRSSKNPNLHRGQVFFTGETFQILGSISCAGPRRSHRSCRGVRERPGEPLRLRERRQRTVPGSQQDRFAPGASLTLTNFHGKPSL